MSEACLLQSLMSRRQFDNFRVKVKTEIHSTRKRSDAAQDGSSHLCRNRAADGRSVGISFRNDEVIVLTLLSVPDERQYSR